MEAERNNPGILKSAIPNAHHYVPVVEAPPPSSVPGEAGTLVDRICFVCKKPLGDRGVFVRAKGGEVWHRDCYESEFDGGDRYSYTLGFNTGLASLTAELEAARAEAERYRKALVMATVTLWDIYRKDFEKYMDRLPGLLAESKLLKDHRVEDYLMSALAQKENGK
jgi:hypothetical protein